jgi:hypothetical protein
MTERKYTFYIEWDGFDEKGNAEPQRVVWTGLTEKEAIQMHGLTEDRYSHMYSDTSVKRFGWKET